MTADESVSDCYMHSREFTHGRNRFHVRINDDRMTYTVIVSREDRVITRRTNLGPEVANCSPAALANHVFGRE
jgi:hypothetical protein